MKKDIRWHQQCLANRRATLTRAREQIERMELAYQRDLLEIERYSEQIQRAISEGRNGFDPDRYGKSRAKGGEL